MKDTMKMYTYRSIPLVTLRQPMGLTATNTVETQMGTECKYLSADNLPRIGLIRGKWLRDRYHTPIPPADP